MAITLKINELNNKSGNRKNRNLAMLDSSIATNKQKTNTFIKKITIASETPIKFVDDDIPQGKNKFAPKARKIRNLLAAAHSISANLLPEYSKIIAS